MCAATTPSTSSKLDLTGTLGPDRVPASYRTLIDQGWVHYFDYTWGREHNKAEPLTFGTVQSKLWKVLEAGHHDVRLTRDEMHRVKCWTDLNCPLWPDYIFRPNRLRAQAGRARRRNRYHKVEISCYRHDMNSRERILAAIQHQRPDRTPCDFWAEPPAWNRLLAHVGPHRPRPAAGRTWGWMCGTSRRDRRRRSARSGGGVFQNFWGERFVQQPTPWGRCARTCKGRWPGETVLAIWRRSPGRRPTASTARSLRSNAGATTSTRLLYGFADVWQRPALVRGWEEFFLDMAERPEWVHFLCRKFTDFYLEDYTRAAEVTGGRIDLYLSSATWAASTGPLISLTMFREFVAPYLKEMIDRIHGLGGRVLFHSCG